MTEQDPQRGRRLAAGEPREAGRRRRPAPERNQPRLAGILARIGPRWLVFITVAIVAVVAASIGIGFSGGGHSHDLVPAAVPHKAALPRMPAAYLGVYTSAAPSSYSGVNEFTSQTGVDPGVVSYYSGWGEPFQTSFATSAVNHDAVPLVQIDPTDIKLSLIAGGHYDAYLRAYAAAVKKFGARVILSFGHEMNGHWYSWGYQHTSPAVFVAAWRHIVTVFRQQGAANVTWLWTINVIGRRGHIPSPAPWWPGASYVTWVGIDGYYYKPSWQFAPLFGPTIKAVRRLTIDPILISETSVAPVANQPKKIADLFAGIRAYGLLGFIWFDVNRNRNWRLSSPAAIAAFRHGASSYDSPAS